MPSVVTIFYFNSYFRVTCPSGAEVRCSRPSVCGTTNSHSAPVDGRGDRPVQRGPHGSSTRPSTNRAVAYGSRPALHPVLRHEKAGVLALIDDTVEVAAAELTRPLPTSVTSQSLFRAYVVSTAHQDRCPRGLTPAPLPGSNHHVVADAAARPGSRSSSQHAATWCWPNVCCQRVRRSST